MGKNRRVEALRRLAQNPVRAAILEAVQREPGVLQTELAVRLGCARATVRHHLHVLERAGLVRILSHGQRCAAFPADMERAQQDARAVLQRGRTLDFARRVLVAPGLAQSDLGMDLGMSRKLLRKYIDRLVQEGLIEEQHGPPTMTYYPTHRLREVLVGPTPDGTASGGMPPMDPAVA